MTIRGPKTDARALRLLHFLMASLATLVVLSCSGDGGQAIDPRGPAAAVPAAAPEPAPSGEIDVATVMRRVRLRFRPDGDGWVGGVSSYTARVGVDGMRFSPRVSAKDGRPVRTGAPIVLGAPSVARGGAAGAAKAAAIVDEKKGLAIDRGLAAEALENTEQGLEQSFRFAARPEGKGDVTVRIPVSGLRYDGATTKGLHFVDDATRMGVRYGAATWVDAKGARTPVALAHDAGTIVLMVPAALVDGSAYPAVLDPVIGPEIGTDAPIYSGSGGYQYLQAVSYGGGQHLVVWYEPAPQGGNDYAFWAARVSAAGSVLDPYGIYLTYGGENEVGINLAAVAFDGTSWLVAWVLSSGTTNAVYGTLVSAAGVAANPGGVLLASPGSNYVLTVAVSYAASANTYLVSYTDSSYAVRGQLVKASGSSSPGMPQGSPFTISTVFTSGSAPLVASAFNGTNFLVAYAQINNTDVYAREVTPGGTPVGGDILAAAGGFDAFYLSVASDGADWMIAFASTSNDEVKVARVTAAGVAPDEASGGVLANGSAGTVQGIGIVWDGADYDVLYDKTIGSTDDIYCARMSTSATLVGGYGPLIGETGSHFSPVVSFDTVNDFFFVAFDDNRLATTSEEQEIRFDRFNTAFTKQESQSVLVTMGANDQQGPNAGWNGTDWLVVWEDSRDAVPYIYGVRVDMNGNVLDTNAIQISPTATFEALNARVTSDGTNWLVVYLQSGAPSGMDAVRVGPSGTVLDTTPVGFAGNAFFGPSFGVAFGSGTYAVTYYNVNGVLSLERLSTTNVPLGNTTIASGTAFATAYSAVAFNGTSFLVTYAENGNPVQAKRVTPAGAVLDTTALTVSASTATSDLAVTAMGGQWLAGWVETNHVHAARISAAGGVIDPGGFVVASAANSQLLADMNNDGTNYWLIWNDDRTNGYSYDVWGGRVSSAGAPIDGTGFPIVTALSAPGLQTPALSAGPSGNLFVTYARLQTSPSEEALRVYSRILTASTAGNGTSCTTASECTSGFCVGDVCCNTACTGVCQVCTTGTCGNAAAGTDPNSSCTATAMSTCGQTGVCNGTGACALWPSGTVCAASTCVGDVATPEACDGNGNCAGGTGTTCAPYVCAAGACKTSCATSADCVAGDTCSAGVCGAALGNGGACSTASQCQSGFCVDGVCCNTACNGVCQACTTGVCGNAVAGTDPNSSCTATAMSTCGQTGVCNGTGACALWASGTTCGSPTCQGTVVKMQSCNGTGTCGLQAGGTDCTPYTCAAGACVTSCTTSANCASGYVCSGGACVIPAGNGGPCTLGSDCGTGFCVDGVCCNTACTGLCQACSAALKGTGADGACGPVMAGTDPGAQCTMQASSTCGQTGQCDGTGACQLYPSGTMCGSPICLGTVVKQHSCDGMDTCGLQAGGTDCTPYACSGGACATTCTTDADCASGFTCTGGSCGVSSTSTTGTGGAAGGGGSGSTTSATSTTGSGGATGSTTSASSTTGSGGTGGSGTSSGTPGSKSGCGCRTAGGEDAPSPGAWLVVAGLAIAAARRRSATS